MTVALSMMLIVRVEVFVDAPDPFIARALAGGAASRGELVEHEMPWETHRQGGFVDPPGHVWSVGDRTPLARQAS